MINIRNGSAAVLFIAATTLLAIHSHNNPAYFIAMFFSAVFAGHHLEALFGDHPVWDMEDHRVLNALLSVKFLEHK